MTSSSSTIPINIGSSSGSATIASGGATSIGSSIGSANVSAPSYSWTTGSQLVSPGVTIDLSVKEPELKMELSIADTGDAFKVTFFDEENGQRVRMVLDPEPDITPREAVHLNVLLAATSAMAMAGAPSLNKLRALEYARRHNITRHFKLSVA